ncbi:acetylcholine receptor subunit alpha-type acr-16-like [Bradysia coprophila]|uniref:acetylcholine receptor subunit alpha-type acr-16-like n=1 Tax=Bradysia coprophila TaxID=38358 RepID=UPI00187DDA30|nr:acetylcholine receptor subunit alpha-type acr-16-like [Bradysia coprophila]
MSITRTEIWAPDIQLYNLAEYDMDIKGYTRNILTNDGKISDGLPMLIKSTCKIDVTWFPFDEQKCLLIFGSWSFSSTELRLELSENVPSYMNGLTSNGEWQVLGVTAETGLQFDHHQPTELYVVVNYTIHLKRRTVYYFFNLLVPCGLIGFLSVLGFTLPPESGEKLPLGASILFSLIVFLNMISESMPASSDAVPLLGTYFNCIMFSIALSVVSTIVVNLNMNAVHPKHIQGRSKKLFMYWLPQLLCMKKPSFIEQMGQIPPISKRKISDTNAMCTVPLDVAWKQQWIFIAAVVDRLCLICSLLFTCVSVTVFLANAF